MHETPIHDVMTREVISITPDLKVDVALETMRARGIRRLPVLSRRTGRVAGIITRDDAALAMPSGATFYGQGTSLEEIPSVREVMTTDVATIGPDETVGHAAQRMAERKIGALPVVDEEHQLVGLVTESDLFRHIARHFGELAPPVGDLP